MKHDTKLKRRECERLFAGLLAADGIRYFLYTAASGQRWVVRADCPHRGGPLYLGELDAVSNAIRCPWHRLLWPERVLLSRSVPAVRVDTEWAVVVPDASACKTRPVPPTDHSVPKLGDSSLRAEPCERSTR